VFAKFEDVYSLWKNKVGNVFAKFIGAQYGIEKKLFGLPNILLLTF
jgi:hypothetical protein